MRLKDILALASSNIKRWLSRATEPYFLFPAIAIVVLTVIWGTTLNLIRIERAAAENAVALSTQELAETYEAQVFQVFYISLLFR
ncbi:MAG: hypothetical protein H0W85_06530 [Methylotenera sp.]|nr:hypothetical protein [Methylotenera sp.]